MTQRNAGLKSFISTVAILRALRVKLVSGEVVVTGAGEEGIGSTTHGAAAKAPVAVQLDGHTEELVSAGAVVAGANVYSAADGKVDDAVSGLRLGIALQAAGGADENLEVLIKPLGA